MLFQTFLSSETGNRLTVSHSDVKGVHSVAEGYIVIKNIQHFDWLLPSDASIL